MKHLFTEHPATVGETYFQHLFSALSFSVHMALGCVACLIHALLPFLFEKTGSSKITMLYDRMVLNRSRLSDNPPAPSSAKAATGEVPDFFARHTDAEA